MPASGYRTAVVLIRGGTGEGATLAFHDASGVFTARPAYDVTADGYADIFVCQWAVHDLPGGFVLVAGGPSGRFPLFAGPLSGPRTYDCPEVVGDLDGDGRDDYFHEGRLIFGRSSDRSRAAPAAYRLVVGDMNGDGYDELLAAPGASAFAVIPGGPTGPGSPVEVPLP
jgi:hypothetical protein